MAKRKSNKALDAKIEALYYKNAQGVQISILDISKVFDAGYRAVELGEDLEAAVKAAIAKYGKAADYGSR